MGEKIKVSNELNGPEINAMIKAILEDSEIIEAMKKIGVPVSEVYKDVSNEVSGLAKRAENEEKAAKKFIKVQVLKYLMAKECDKTAEENDEKVKKEVDRITATEEQQQIYNDGNINELLAMMQEGIVIGPDGKTAKKLTPQERKELVALLKEGYMPLSAALKQIEFEEEEQEVNDTSKVEVEESQPETVQPEESLENVEQADIVENEAEKNDEYEEVSTDGYEDYDEVDDDTIEEEQMQEELSSASLEDYNYRLASNNEKRVALENNPEYGQEYENIECYIPPVDTTIEDVAEFIMKFQEENPNQKLTVVFNGYLVDPQKFSSPTEIIDTYKEKIEEHRKNNINEFQDALEALSSGTINDSKKVGELAKKANELTKDAKEAEIIHVPEEQQQGQEAGQEAENESDEHPYPTFPEDR